MRGRLVPHGCRFSRRASPSTHFWGDHGAAQGLIDAPAGGFYLVGLPRDGGPDNAMNKTQLKKFKKLLESKREEIIRRAQQTLEHDMALDSDDLPDEMDLASSEYLQAFTFRLRGREKTFLDKIQKALERIEDGSFGMCEECGEPISVKRLEARPETTLCIRCKEDQERVERDFS
jgi:DnaK suppressor protein